MRIWINEIAIEAGPKDTLFALRDRHKEGADLIIANGFPAAEDRVVVEGDRLVFIRRGEQPSEEELETLMASRHTPGVHRRVKAATVAIAGVGGLGSAIAVALARVGVGHLVVADFDVVEPSNLNRQQYFVDQIGLPKVEALKDNLARINPYVTVTACNGRLTGQNIPELFAGADVVVEAFDAADQKALLTETVLLRLPKVPLVAASGLAGYAPSNTIVTRRATGRLYLVGDGETAAAPGQGLMAPRVGIAAHHQANAVLRLLLGEEPE